MADAGFMTNLASVSPSEFLIIVLRLMFVILLYALVVAVLLALRQDLAQSPQPPPGEERRHGRSPRLTLVEAASADGPAGRAVPLAGEVLIGRRPPADVLLRDDAVSGRHARITRHDGAWRIEDVGSTNGTYVNGRRLDRQDGPAPLRPGDVVTTGNAVWRFDNEAGD
ncbi:MAG: FHA domain-containing protein [Chloroflexota bacterium]